jgi:hypothetical protein
LLIVVPESDEGALMLNSLFLAIGAFMTFFFAIVGAIFAVSGLVMIWRRIAILPRGVRVTGEIVRWERSSDGEVPPSYAFFPHVRFLDSHGQAQEMRVDVAYQSEKHPIGYAYDVRFDPHNPRRAYTANIFWMLLGPIVWCGLGVVALWVGLVGMR